MESRRITLTGLVVVPYVEGEQGPATASPPYRTRSGTDVEQRRRVIVALFQQHQNGLTAREIHRVADPCFPVFSC